MRTCKTQRDVVLEARFSYIIFSLSFQGCIQVSSLGKCTVVDTEYFLLELLYAFLTDRYTLPTLFYIQVILCYQIITTWYNDKAWAFLAVGGFVTILFSFFNAFGCVIPFTQRWLKFRNKSVEFESLPGDASEKQRRQSMFDLQAAADDLLLEASLNERLITEDRIRLFLDGRNERIAKRRHTMPPRQKPAQWGSTRLVRGFSVPANVWKGD